MATGWAKNKENERWYYFDSEGHAVNKDLDNEGIKELTFMDTLKYAGKT